MIPKEEINGCGGKGGWFKPPYSAFFKSSCNKHDKGYYKGGTEIDRMNCDANFLRYMLIDCQRIKNKFKRWYFKRWAFVYFKAVRVLGKKYFNYKV